MSGPEILTTTLAGQWVELHFDGIAVECRKAVGMKPAVDWSKAVEF